VLVLVEFRPDARLLGLLPIVRAPGSGVTRRSKTRASGLRSAIDDSSVRSGCGANLIRGTTDDR
jgi:hypothetical protein